MAAYSSIEKDSDNIYMHSILKDATTDVMGLVKYATEQLGIPWFDEMLTDVPYTVEKILYWPSLTMLMGTDPAVIQRIHILQAQQGLNRQKLREGTLEWKKDIHVTAEMLILQRQWKEDLNKWCLNRLNNIEGWTLTQMFGVVFGFWNQVKYNYSAIDIGASIGSLRRIKEMEFMNYPKDTRCSLSALHNGHFNCFLYIWNSWGRNATSDTASKLASMLKARGHTAEYVEHVRTGRVPPSLTSSVSG